MYCTETETHIAKRKVRNCDWCWEHILIGGTYRRYRYYDDRTASTMHMHPECHEAMQEAAHLEGGWYEWVPGQERPREE